MNQSLKDKNILIIGGGSVIGLAVAKKICEMGGNVMIASRSIMKNKEHIQKEIGIDVTLLTLDVTSESESKHILKKAGPLDHLIFTIRPDVNLGLFAVTDVHTAQQAFVSKLWGPYQFIQKAKDHIRPGGSIVLTSGIAGEKIYKGASAMAMINSATETLCRSLSVELSPLRVNVVSPGFVAPKNEQVEQYAEGFPLKRLAKPEEITDAYIFLMSNTYTTGTKIVVDGGARLI